MSFTNDNPRESKWKSKSGQDGEYFLAKFDARGDLINEDVCGELRRELNDPSYTDVVLISHGYSTKLKSDGSHGVANDTVPSLQATIPEDRKCLYVAVSWPSDVPTTLFDGDDKAPRELVLDMLEELAEIWASGNAPVLTNAFNISEKVEHLKHLMEHILENKAPRAFNHTVDELSRELSKHRAEKTASSTTTSSNIVPVYNSRAHEAAESVKERFRRRKESLEARKESLQGRKESLYEKISDYKSRSISSSPSDTVSVDRSFSLSSGVRAMYRTGKTVKKTYDLLMTLFDVIYNSFERRAQIVGSRGVHDMLALLMQQAIPRVRFHLFSHSMGTHVLQSAALGREPTGSQLTRKVHTLFMAQPACSTDIYAKGGPYRPFVSKLCPIAGPILATIMKDDEALMLYDWFRTKPLGKFGFFNQEPFNKCEVAVIDVPEEKENQHVPIQPVVFEKKTVYNLRAKSVISKHSDFYDKEISSLFWQAAVIDMEENDYVVTDPEDLPKNFWTSYEVRNEGKFEDGWFFE